MRDDYYTDEGDYRPDEEAFDGTEFRYQNMSRDPLNSPKVGSGTAPTHKNQGDRDRNEDYTDFERTYGRRSNKRGIHAREDDFDRYSHGRGNYRRDDEHNYGRDYEPDYRGARFDRSSHRPSHSNSMRPRSYSVDRGYDDFHDNNEDNTYARWGSPEHGYRGPRRATDVGQSGLSTYSQRDDYDIGYADMDDVDNNYSPYSIGSQFGGNQTRNSQSFDTTADRMYANYGRHGGKGPKGYQRSAERIQEEVSEALMWNEDVDASDIEVKVDKCEVTLEGEVSNRRMKRLAETLAEAVRGVKDVHNRLQVKRDRSDSTSDEQKASESPKVTRRERADRNPDNVKKH